ncbi:MAG: mandelate racemase/muconate lactonizing enzyme family protein [Candidatus Latescibacteria bacterium]|jgi:galactonate dehydratase|nr:mandelate racemase/muconate lactonizing enzyme family protein [Candidatus Latescibacterota bacterium]
MKITSVEPFIIENPPPARGGSRWVIVKLTTDSGIEGVGECSWHARQDHVYAALIRDLGDRYVLGANPFDIEKLCSTIYEDHNVRHPGPISTPVLSAIEMACWDIVGKSVGQPVYNLLGGKCHERLRSYSYLSEFRLGEDPQITADLALSYVEEGYTAVKLDPVDVRTSGRLETLRYAANVIGAIRTAVGDRCDILIGTHGQFSTSSAIRFAKRIEEFDPLWFEEPVFPENIKEMARVARSTSVPIATGERLLTKFPYAELLERQAASIIQMDLTITGGILEAKKIAGMAEAYYAEIAPHMYGGPIGGAAAIQLDVCSPNFLIQEGIQKWDGFHGDLLMEPIQWEKGYIIPSERPGLGIELNQAVLDKHAVKI